MIDPDTGEIVRTWVPLASKVDYTTATKCPACGAAPGMECTVGRSARRFHRGRWVAAMENYDRDVAAALEKGRVG